MKPNPKKIKICCALAAIIIITLAIIVTTLAFTVFKPKQPIVAVHLVGLDKIQWGLDTSVTLDMVLSLQNRNYAKFKFSNGTAYVDYHGLLVSKVPIPGDTVPGRSTIDINTKGELTMSEMVQSRYFSDDILSGSLNLTSTSKLPGKAILFDSFKKHATVYTTCNISVSVLSLNAESSCLSRLKF